VGETTGKSVNNWRGLFLAAVFLAAESGVLAQAPSADVKAAPANASSPAKLNEHAPLLFWNRQIVVVRSYYDQVSPAERAARATARLAALPATSPHWDVVAIESTSDQYSGAIVTVNGNFAFVILTSDLDRESGETIKQVSDQAVAQLRAALDARSAQSRWPVLVKGIGLSLFATLLLLCALWGVVRVGRLALARLDARYAAKTDRLKVGGFDLRPLLNNINRTITKLTGWAVVVLLLYLWLTFVLLRFPYSQPWGQQLGSFLTNLFTQLGAGILRAIPGMFTVVVIFLTARLIARVVDGIFRQVERQELQVSWLHADTARATRRLLVVLVWIFAITVAYPYIPGSNSDAFKGVSVFVGLMVSLGSAGLVNQVMSGLVVIYSRALRLGEFVRIGDDLGTVTEVGMLSTKLLTPKREEITIPNAVLVGTKTTNYSRHLPGVGTAIGTSITIGYDAPWRLVHAMLLHAAEQTSSIRKDPAPRVWQKALSDFYVEYELVVNLDKPEERVPILSELHTHIQDAFNEQGVQIMSPHFKSQPNEKVFVPKSQWFSKPVELPTEQNGMYQK